MNYSQPPDALLLARCRVCLRKLTARESVLKRIGPTCARKLSVGASGIQIRMEEYLKERE